MRKRILLASCLCVLAVTSCTIPDNKGQIWNIGVPDSSTVELALGPDRYKCFARNRIIKIKCLTDISWSGRVM